MKLTPEQIAQIEQGIALEQDTAITLTRLDGEIEALNKTMQEKHRQRSSLINGIGPGSSLIHDAIWAAIHADTISDVNPGAPGGQS